MQPQPKYATVHSLKDPAHATYEQANILLVEDDRAVLALLEAELRARGHAPHTARNGVEALDILKEQPDLIDVVVLDRTMPVMDGMHFMGELKRDPQISFIPVIMLTGSDRPEQMREGIDAGVFYYLAKPIDKAVLSSVLDAAVQDAYQKKTFRAEYKRHSIAFTLIDTCRFTFRTLEEAEDLACFIANCYPVPERVLLGLAELFINGVEHGNVNISYDDKTTLLNENRWRQEVARRLALPENREKSVEAILQRKKDGIYIQVTDHGEGFDWRPYLQIDPARATDNHGRGIAQANLLCFDALQYHGNGNQVVARVDYTENPDNVLPWA